MLRSATQSRAADETIVVSLTALGPRPSPSVAEGRDMNWDEACEPDAKAFYNCYQCGEPYRHGEAVNGCCGEQCNRERAREFRERATLNGGAK